MAKADTIRDSNGPEVDEVYENDFNILNSEQHNNLTTTPIVKTRGALDMSVGEKVWRKWMKAELVMKLLRDLKSSGVGLAEIENRDKARRPNFKSKGSKSTRSQKIINIEMDAKILDAKREVNKQRKRKSRFRGKKLREALQGRRVSIL